ncbi:hypothetical protein ACFV2H_17995 [Streptomyces sp. NPDC059629]|uniref:hypothetical protein n=1 Tax=Streptomyces sp. NPDC059629 TaxID=3346889 RepID=UPI0036C5AB33
MTGSPVADRHGQVIGTRLFLKIHSLGYQASRQVVREHLAALWTGTDEPVRADTPSPRTITSWITRSRRTLGGSQNMRLFQVLLACPDITRGCDLARACADTVGTLEAADAVVEPQSIYWILVRPSLDGVTGIPPSVRQPRAFMRWPPSW